MDLFEKCRGFYSDPAVAESMPLTGAGSSHASGVIAMSTVVPAARTEAGGEGEAAQIGFPERMRNFGAGWRVLIWLAVIGSLPFAFVKIVCWAVSGDSNAASSALLLSLTAIGILLCLFLMGFRLVGGWEIFILCLAAVLAVLHNFLACDWLADRCA